jgi:hypothetical protein
LYEKIEEERQIVVVIERHHRTMIKLIQDGRGHPSTPPCSSSLAISQSFSEMSFYEDNISPFFLRSLHLLWFGTNDSGFLVRKEQFS